MDFEKANEIFESKDVVKVLYYGQSVWIENLNPVDKTANITLDNDTHINIPVDELELDRN